MIYLDSAATAFHRPPEVAQAVLEAMQTVGNSGRGAHGPALEASRTLYRTRERLARLLECRAENVAFAANVTQALNTAISGLIHPGDHVITTAAEHNSVLRPLYRKEAEGTELTILPADRRGAVDFSQLDRALRPNTRAVVLGHASNVTGNVVNLTAVGRWTREHQVLLIVDAAQTAGELSVSLTGMGIDVLCFTGHKGLLGPQGTGGLCLREGLPLPPLLVGGSGIRSYERQQPTEMPEALEAGTQNIHGIAGLGAGVEYILRQGVEAIHRETASLAERFAAQVRSIPGVTLYGDWEAPLRAPIVSLNIGDLDAGEVSELLWEKEEICTRPGAHCAPLMHQALGTVDQGVVRFSFSCFNTLEEVDLAAACVEEIAREQL